MSRPQWVVMLLVLANVAMWAWRTNADFEAMRQLPPARQPLPEGTPGLPLLKELEARGR